MLKRLLAIALALALVFSLTACSKSGEGGDKETDGGKFSESEIKLPDYKPTSDKVVLLTQADPAQLKDPNLWIYSLNEKMKLEYGCELEYIRTTSAELPVKAAQLVLSGQSPDLIEYRTKDDPTFISNKIVRAVDDIFDFNEPVFQHVKELNEQFRINGKLYTLVRNYRNNAFTFWWEEDLRELGLETPRELYYKDQWTWSKLEEYANLLTVKGSDGSVSRYGVGYEQFLHTVTGETLVNYSNGTYTNNLRSSKLADFFNFTARLCYDSKVMPVAVNQFEQFKAHKTSILVGARTYLDNHLMSEMLSDEVSFAPVPRWDGADKYYTPAGYGTTWVAEGAKNLEGVGAYFAVYILLISDIDPQIKEAVKSLAVATKGYTDEDYALLDEATADMAKGYKDGKFELVRICDEGLGVNWSANQRGDFLNQVMNWNKPWATAVEENAPLLNAAIKEAEDQKAKLN